MIIQAYGEEDFRRLKGVNLAKSFFPQPQAEMDTLKQVSTAFRQLESNKTILPGQYQQSKEKLNKDKLQTHQK
ncbi:hypothetical protein [Desulfovibrio cuneatus]|uniref:hypothetical protein n=1 Tax=Desulfovibrio cuneatus TaxID=159728 RepID=UPI0012EBB95D|nr:hypothetical protein [Desulfovibrio cuneatus]